MVENTQDVEEEVIDSAIPTVEDMEEVHRNVLTAIEAVYGVDFKDSIWFPMTATEGKISVSS